MSTEKMSIDSYCKDDYLMVFDEGYLIVFNEDKYEKRNENLILAKFIEDIEEYALPKGIENEGWKKYLGQYFKKGGEKKPLIGIVVSNRGQEIHAYWLTGPVQFDQTREFYYMKPEKVLLNINSDVITKLEECVRPLAEDRLYKLYKVKICLHCREKRIIAIGFADVSSECESKGITNFISKSFDICKLFKSEKNLIFYGPPGTGKTYFARKYVFRSFYEVKEVVFHPSYSYEEFIGGIYPTARRGRLLYRYKKGIFFELCERAKANPGKLYLLFIDEINRANLSAVFGEALNLIEKDKRGEEVEISYGMKLSVPENLYILGTMNTLDKSVAGIDYAMRRRFAFVRFSPNSNLVVDSVNKEVMKAINQVLGEMLGWDYLIGHAYFMDEDLAYILSYKVMPLIEEYFGGDQGMINSFWKRVCNRVKGEDGNIVREVFLELYGYDLKC